MTFRDALVKAIKGSDSHNWTGKQVDAAGKIHDAPAKHPMFWRAAEFVVRRRYHKETGKMLPRSFDFSKIVEWLKENMGTILQILIPLLVLLI